MTTATPTIAKAPRPFFLGWWLVLGAATVQLLTGLLVNRAFGIYFVKLQDEFRWSKTALSGTYAMIEIENGIMGPVQGWLVDRLGARMVVRMGLVLLMAGFLLFSRVSNLGAFYAAYIVMALGISMAGNISLSVAVNHWFHRRRTFAMGLVHAGSGVGGVMLPLLAWAMTVLGWRGVALGSVIVILVVGFPASFLLRSRPERYGLTVDGIPPGESAPPDGGTAKRAAPVPVTSPDFSAREALRTPAFWFIAAGHASALLMVTAVNVHLVPYLVNDMKMSLEVAGTLMAALVAFQVTGQVGGGLVADRLNKRRLAQLAMVGHCVGILILAYATNVAWVVVFAALHGLSWGLRGPLMNSMRADYFGRRRFGTIIGFASLVVTTASIPGPLLAGYVADRTGQYHQAFFIFAAMAALGVLFFEFARRPAPPRRTEGSRDATGTLGSAR